MTEPTPLHRTEITRTWPKTAPVYRVYCSCGWISRDCESQKAATAEEDGHIAYVCQTGL